MILAICSTPFQMLNLITMNSHLFQNEKVDVILLNHAAVNHSIYEKLKKFETFNQVYFAETKHISDGGNSNSTFIRDLVEFKRFLNKDYILDQVSLEPENYNKVLVPSDDIPSRVFWYHIKEHNQNAELYLYEDGTKSYIFFDLSESTFKSFYLNKLFHTGFFDEIKGAYLHHPKYFEYDRDLELIQIPPIDKDNYEVRKIMNDVFDYKDEVGMVENDVRFLFFDQALQFDSEINEQKRLFNLIDKTTQNEELTVKVHPRTDGHKYKRSMAGDYPFEIMELNQDVSNKVLISIASTASLSSKLVFDEEPYVILLYKLMNSSIFQRSQQANFAFAEKVQADYEHENRFFIPETEEELIDIIQELSFNHPTSQLRTETYKSKKPYSYTGIGVSPTSRMNEEND